MPENKASLNTENPTILKTTAVKRKLRMVPVIPVMLTVIMGLLVLGVASITTCLDWHSSKKISIMFTSLLIMFLPIIRLRLFTIIRKN